MGLDGVLSDLEASGYTTRTFAIPAAGVDAPHRRERLWILAHADSGRQRRGAQQNLGEIKPEQQTPRRGDALRCDHARQKWLPEPDVGRVAHGVPNRVDRLRALGNAVVPQVVAEIGRAILMAERDA
jgi:DNA (cytosine-5)-methyltransferase 1